MNSLILTCILLVTCRFILVRSTANGDVVLDNFIKVFVEKENKYLPICWENNTTTSIVNTVCRQLGFARASKSFSISLLPLSKNVIYIKSCASGVPHIFRCDHSIIHFTNCTSRKVVLAECVEEDYIYEGQLRLYKDPLDSTMSSNSDGHLLVYLKNTWTPVCIDTFGDHEANSSCRQLGYTRSTYYYGTVDQQSYSSDDQNIMWIGTNHTEGQLDCSRSVQCLTMCYKRPDRGRTCESNETVYLKCDFDEKTDNVQLMKGGTISSCRFRGGPSKGYITGIAIGLLAFIFICTIGIVGGCYFCVKAKKPWDKSRPTKPDAVSLTKYVQNEEYDTDEHEEKLQYVNTYHPPMSLP
ncbi:neurotrypsin-like isoform X2 [Dysidea avara]|uniref:neurotrypsin-like isoform X2 n=1 Tax=Dysidea avara TaxID=196820 RepID=UPI0033304F1D